MNDLKSLRKQFNLSQSEFAKKYGIPLRTLQKWEQQVNDPLPYLMSLIQKDIDREQYINIEKYVYKSTNKFERVIRDNYQNIERIHPIQQQRVSLLIQTLKQYREVKKIIVFGSSVTYKCNYESDLDIYVELSKNINVKKYNLDCPVDFWTNFSVEPVILKEIKKKGVIVYDCRNILPKSISEF